MRYLNSLAPSIIGLVSKRIVLVHSVICVTEGAGCATVVAPVD